MEEKIKNFDRSIEQRMNESTVAPPFGMWNRISAELDGAEALPIAAPASVISSRVVYGFIGVAALIGTSMLTALWMNHSNKTLNQPLKNDVAVAVISNTEVVSPARTSASTSEQQVKPTSEFRKAKRSGIAAEQTSVTPVVIAQPVQINMTAINTEVAVPKIANNIPAQGTDVYYFPPVDMSSVENEKGMIAEEAHNINVEEKAVEKKSKSISSSSNDKRISIKKRKRGGFTYGSLNRLKKQKPKY